MELTGSQAMATLSQALGKRIKSAASSLNSFSIELDDGSALIAKASFSEGDLTIVITSTEASSLPKLADAVCSVDWAWICGSSIKTAAASEDRLKLGLDPAGPLSVSVGIWQGSPFLGFQPFRPPKS